MKSSARNIKLTSYEDIFETDEARMDSAREKVQEIPLAELFSFEKHPFKVRDDKAMRDMVESIEKFGVLVPAIARPRVDGGYELIAGHRRKHGCELAGKETMPVIIRELDDDAATIIMVDSNLQRETLLPSERAFAYKMKLEAMKRQGERTDLTSRQVGGRLEAADIIGRDIGESGRQVQRYIRITELIPELLDMVDGKKMAFGVAVELSYLQKSEQGELLDAIRKYETAPSLSQSGRLKKLSSNGNLSADVMGAIMSEEKTPVEKVTFSGDRLKKYFPKDYTTKQMEEVIIKLLESWRK